MSEDPSYLGRYRIVSRIGAGAMGDVYLAEDPQIDRRLAIKTVKLHGSAEEVETRKQRMLVEARAAGRIVHPHAVTLFDAGEDAGTVFLAFEFVEGQDLGVKLKGGEPITLREALTIVRQTADALHHAHQLGIVHRDIKPSNIMLTGSGSAKIGDFGIAKVHNQQTELTTTGMLVGTPHYMSPEQVRGETLDGRSDVFSLGSVLFELLHRRRPFPSDTLTTLVYQILHEDPTQDLRANLPAGVGELVRGMLEKDFRKRLDARQVSEKLTGLLSDLSADQLAHDASTVEGVTAPGGAPPAPGPAPGPPPPPDAGSTDDQPTALMPSTGGSGTPVPAVSAAAAAEVSPRRWLPWVVAVGCVGILGLGAVVAGLFVLSGLEQAMQSTEEQTQASVPDVAPAPDEPEAEGAVSDPVDDTAETDPAEAEPIEVADADVPARETEREPVAPRTAAATPTTRAAPPPVVRRAAREPEPEPTRAAEVPAETNATEAPVTPPEAADVEPVAAEATPTFDLDGLTVNEERDVSTSVGFRVKPDDAFVLFRAPGDARPTNIGRARNHDMKRKRRGAFRLPGPGPYLLIIRREGYTDYTLRVNASDLSTPTLIEVELSQ